MVENVTQINIEITEEVGVSVKAQKHIMCAKSVMFGILVLVPVKMVHIPDELLRIQWFCVIKLQK